MEVGQSNKVIAIIQARMQSTRLPGKVLMPMPFTGETCILGQIVNQLSNPRLNLSIIVATSINMADDAIETFCNNNNILVFRGDEEDVHSRFLKILEDLEYDTAIRITGDNPIVDVELLELVLQNHFESNSDYSYTTDLPIGMNFEVFDVRTFLKLAAMELTSDEKEHVTLKLKTEESTVKNLVKIDTRIHNKIRVTIDYPSDYLMLSAVFDIAFKQNIEPSLRLIHFVLDNYPWLFEVNSDNFQKRQFNNMKEEIQYSLDLLNSLDLKESAKYLSSHV